MAFSSFLEIALAAFCARQPVQLVFVRQAQQQTALCNGRDRSPPPYAAYGIAAEPAASHQLRQRLSPSGTGQRRYEPPFGPARQAARSRSRSGPGCRGGLSSGRIRNRKVTDRRAGQSQRWISRKSSGMRIPASTRIPPCPVSPFFPFSMIIPDTAIRMRARANRSENQVQSFLGLL